jgi:hypothetical protein
MIAREEEVRITEDRADELSLILIAEEEASKLI